MGFCFSATYGRLPGTRPHSEGATTAPKTALAHKSPVGGHAPASRGARDVRRPVHKLSKSKNRSQKLRRVTEGPRSRGWGCQAPHEGLRRPSRLYARHFRPPIRHPRKQGPSPHCFELTRGSTLGEKHPAPPAGFQVHVSLQSPCRVAATAHARGASSVPTAREQIAIEQRAALTCSFSTR